VELYARKGDPRARAILEKGRERGKKNKRKTSDNDSGSSSSGHGSIEKNGIKGPPRKKKRTN
jgi:hypothetical protein